METLNIDLNHLEKILIVQTAFLGDVILTLPLAHHLKKHNPAYKITFLLKKELQEIKEINSYFDDYIFIDKSKYISSIRSVVHQIKNKFDVVISPHRSTRSALISFLSNTKIRISFDISSLSFLYTHRIPYKRNIHEIERNLDLIKFMVPVTDWEEKIFLKLDKYVLNDTFMLWKDKGELIVVVAPGTVWETKRYPEYYYASVIKNLIENDIKVVLIGSKQDLEVGLRIQKYVDQSSSLLNLIGKLRLRESISLINLSDLLICNDSAPTHMAIFTDTPVLTIYGSTVPEFGFFPFRNFDRKVQIENLKCKPCGIHGYMKCPEKHFRCMIDLTPEIVFKTAIQILSKNYSNN